MKIVFVILIIWFAWTAVSACSAGCKCSMEDRDRQATSYEK